jgi:hypothetical protein
MKFQILHHRILSLVVIFWVVSIVVGTSKINSYNSRPGERSEVSMDWPATSAIARDTRQPTLIMFAHPRCPCTDASIGELDTLLADIGNRIKVSVVFYQPVGVDAEWMQTRLRRAAESIPGVTVLLDPEGRETRRFGAETSGHVYLYSPEGRLLFEGGITPSRAHAGGNYGRSSIAALAQGQQPSHNRTPVFGCPIMGLGTQL